MGSQKIQKKILIFSCPVHSLEIETKASFKPKITTDQREKEQKQSKKWKPIRFQK